MSRVESLTRPPSSWKDFCRHGERQALSSVAEADEGLACNQTPNARGARHDGCTDKGEHAAGDQQQFAALEDIRRRAQWVDDRRLDKHRGIDHPCREF